MRQRLAALPVAPRWFDSNDFAVLGAVCNVFEADAAPTRLWKQGLDVLRMRADSVPVLGFTWYSLIDQVDGDIGLAETRGTVNECGLFDMNRSEHPIGRA